jgi:hypothetical protein
MTHGDIERLIALNSLILILEGGGTSNGVFLIIIFVLIFLASNGEDH